MLNILLKEWDHSLKKSLILLFLICFGLCFSSSVLCTWRNISFRMKSQYPQVKKYYNRPKSNINKTATTVEMKKIMAIKRNQYKRKKIMGGMEVCFIFLKRLREDFVDFHLAIPFLIRAINYQIMWWTKEIHWFKSFI